ncbi:Myosin light chain kinase family member 4 [Taenia crassiceps]|uniref:Myosin light chain kinase family member 4 n=1 Tax=Taenia crassiceps TaxID=6207 RepID=A0ABR4QNE4_9CEST
MPYEPVLAPAGVTSDSTSSASEDSGFRHYLRKVSSLDTPKQVISTVFIIPQNEVLSDQLFSENYDNTEVQAWKHPQWREYTSADRTSLTDPSSATTMGTAATATSAIITNTESGFQDGGLSSSTISSIESPRSTSVEHVEEEAEEVVKHLRHPATYQSRSHINLQPRGGQVITSWIQKIFRWKESESPKDPENPIFEGKRRLSAVIPPHEPRLKFLGVYRAEKQREQRVVSMRSIEVTASEPSENTTTSTEPTVHWTEYVTKVCKPPSTETVLHTTCLQTTCEETSHVSSPPHVAFNPPIQIRVGRVETASFPTTSASWTGSDFSSLQRTSVASVFSDLGSPAPRHVNWENKSTSPFTVLPTFGEESGESLVKRPPARDRPHWHHNDSDSMRLSTRIYLDSNTSYSHRSDDSTPIESENFYDPVDKKFPYRECQNENPPRSSQSTPVCIARCQSFVADRSSKGSSKDTDSSKVDGKFIVTQSQRDFKNGCNFLEDDESRLNLSPDVKNSVAKTVVQISFPSTPGHQQHSDGAEVMGKTVEEKSSVVTRTASGIKTAAALDRSSSKLANKTLPSVVCRRNRDIANGVQSPLSPHPAGTKTRRVSGPDGLATSLQTNNEEDGKFAQPVNSSCPLNSIKSYPQSRVSSGCREKGLGGQLPLLRDVDGVGDPNDSICNVEESKDLTAVALVNAAKEGTSGNYVSMRRETVHETLTNFTPVNSRPDTQDLSGRNKNLNSSAEIVTPVPQQIPNASAINTSEKKFASPTLVNKPVAKVLPSTIVEGNKTQTTLLEKSSNSHVNSKTRITKKVQPQGQIVKKESDGELSTSLRMNGLTKAAEEVLSVNRTSTSKNHQVSIKAVKEIEILPSNSTQISTNLTFTAPEKGLIQIVPPTVQESQVHTVETQRKPRISPESTLQMASRNGNPRAPQLEATSTPSHPKTLVSLPPQTVTEQGESLDKTPVSRDSATVSTLSSMSPALQSSNPDKVLAAEKRNQTTPTSSTGQHFFPKTHQLPQSSSGAINANHGRGVGEEVEILQEGTLKASRTPTPTLSSASPIKSAKIKRRLPVTKRPQTARIFRTGESEGDFFMLLADTHKDAKPEDHFTIYEDIGKGKFGKVVRCENKQTHKIMAMKEIKTDRLPRHCSGDIMEVAVLRAIGRHDNIACFFSAYEVQHACFIVTEYVCGGALYDRVVAEDNLDEKISASIIRQLLLGLEHIQACSVLHLDLKPENVMMVASSGYQLKIIDFGLAYFYDPKRPRRQMGGTYIYSAPETINYDFQSFATDIWSVAVIAYELLSGITPFECPQSGDPERELTLSEITTNILNCCYNFEDDGICDASDKAKDFIRTILKKNPRDRPSVEACLKHPWMEMSDELPTVRRAVSIRRRASAKEKTRPFEISHHWITTDDATY